MAAYRQWQCPFCGHFAIIRGDDYSADNHRFQIDNKEGWKFLQSEFYVCPNIECNRFQLVVSLYEPLTEFKDFGKRIIGGGELIKKWNLIPPSMAKSFPSYIPEAIILD